MYNQVYKWFERTDLVLVLSWGDMRVVEQLMCIRYHFSSLLGIVSSLFVVSVSKSKRCLLLCVQSGVQVV